MDARSCIHSFIDNGSVESHQLFRVRHTVFEMLKDRGYNISESELSVTLPEFRTIYGAEPDLDRLKIIASLTSNPSKKILVVFCGADLIRIKNMRECIEQMHKEDVFRMIIIFRKALTTQARKATQEISSPYKVELFQMADLLINVTKHILKPKHAILTTEEKQKLLKKYSVEDKQLPRILESDAIARYYGLEKGQVVKVSYSGELTKSHVTYRCVT